MAMIRNLYYAAWANLSEFSVTIRAAIVLAVLVVLAWVIVRPLLFRLLLLLLKSAGLLTKLICLICGKILGITFRKSPEKYAVQYNRMAELMGRCNERLVKWSENLAGKRKFHLGWMLLLYGVLMLLICLPTLLKPVVSEEYIPYFSFASDLYRRAEAPALEAAALYSPLFSSDSDDTVEEPEPEEEPADEVWLSLSERGINGSNVRAGPGESNKVLCTVKGDIQLLYLDEINGRWVYVRTEDGVEGWIHDSLVTGVPEQALE